MLIDIVYYSEMQLAAITFFAVTLKSNEATDKVRNSRSFAARLLTFPSEVSERTVGLSHLVRVLTLLYSVSFFLSSELELSGESLVHWHTLLATSCTDDPAECERETALWAHLTRNLVVRSTDTARAHFHEWTSVAEGGIEDLKWVSTFLAVLDFIKGRVHDLAGGLLLTAEHDVVDEALDIYRLVDHVWGNGWPLLDWTSHMFVIGYVLLLQQMRGL